MKPKESIKRTSLSLTVSGTESVYSVTKIKNFKLDSGQFFETSSVKLFVIYSLCLSESLSTITLLSVNFVLAASFENVVHQDITIDDAHYDYQLGLNRITSPTPCDFNKTAFRAIRLRFEHILISSEGEVNWPPRSLNLTTSLTHNMFHLN